MRAAISFAVVLVLALAVSGCLRNKFDLCTPPQTPPDPNCTYLDAGADAPRSDAGTDAGDDAASVDAQLDANDT